MILSMNKSDGNHLVLPNPFDCIKVTSSKGTCGRCFAFCLTSSGVFSGYDFPQGYRIRNSALKSTQDKLFFLECRNHKKRKRDGLVAAMLPFGEDNRRKARDSGDVIANCRLVVVDGLVSDPSDPSILCHKVHILKENVSISDFVSVPNIHVAIPKYFDVSVTVPVESVKLIFLNTIFGNEKLLHPYFRSNSFLSGTIKHLPLDMEIEGSLVSADIWFQHSSPNSAPRIPSITSTKLFDRETRNFRSKKYKNDPYELLPWSNQQLPSDLLIVTDDFEPAVSLSDLKSKERVHLIPYKFDARKTVLSFVPITETQLKIFKLFTFPMTRGKYRKWLRRFLADSGLSIVTVVRIVPSRNVIVGDQKDEEVGGTIVGHLPSSSLDSILNSSKKANLEHSGINGIYLHRLRRNIPDFNLPFGCAVVFRGYRWPHATNIPETTFSLLEKTFPNKGLCRKSVPHGGNFEMIGQRMSSQATGSMVAYPDTSKHEYYREQMDSSLLPSARAAINVLRDQSAEVAYTSGECLMSLYKKVLDVYTLNTLCKQTIITQKHFFNALHLDDSCHLHRSLVEKVMTSESIGLKERKYIEKVMLLGKKNCELPKATTCCWTQRSKCRRKSMMFQYFVSTSSGFAFDISSYVTEQLGFVGATFLSSLFEHCTSVPVWTSADGLEISLSPYDDKNYNFAWGSNGGSNNDIS